MGKLDIDIAEVKKLVELVEAHNLEELTVEEGDLAITVKGRSSQAAPVIVHTQSHAHVGEQMSVQEEEVYEEAEIEYPEEEPEGNIFDIVASLVGVFYRASSPDAPSFVDVGDFVEVGDEVGLIEAMKVFSPIPSEVSGEVIEIPAENGKLVQQGDVLVRIRLSEEYV